MYYNITNDLIDFIDRSPSCYHVIENMKTMLASNDYHELCEGFPWELKKGGKYFVTRNLSSLIAFQIPRKLSGGFHIIASHSDSPAFKIKENAEIEVDGKYTKLNVEKYGGMLMAPWFDRPLSVAGKIVVKEGGTIASRLVNVDRDLVLIPNLAIHMNRQVNDGYKYNPQIDLLPLYGGGTAMGTFVSAIAETAGVAKADILGTDLFLYNRMPGTIWGADREFLSSGRLDDLQCAFASLRAFLDSDAFTSIPVHCTLDNEEVGSGTKQGAASTFLQDTLKRICLSLDICDGDNSAERYYNMLASSFMLSADNAHAVHPNQKDKSDPTNRPYMNDGIVIKYSASQKYTTDSVSAAVFQSICKKAQVPYQSFFNRSDMTGGSTLGNLSNSQVPMNTVDIGLAQLAMHSPYETAGAKDTEYMARAAKTFFQSSIQYLADGVYEVR